MTLSNTFKVTHEVTGQAKVGAQLLSRGCGHLFLLLLSGVDQKSPAFLEGSLYPDSEMQVSHVLAGWL